MLFLFITIILFLIRIYITNAIRAISNKGRIVPKTAPNIFPVLLFYTVISVLLVEFNVLLLLVVLILVVF